MGYDIDICRFNIVNGVASKSYTVSEMGFSYNWYDFNEICTAHFLAVCPDDGKQCTKIHLWCFRKDVHCRQGKDVLERAKIALKILLERGIAVGTPDPNNSNWYYGVRYVNPNSIDTVKLPPQERAEVFAWWVNNFMKKGQTYGTEYFIGDHKTAKSLIMADGRKVLVARYDDSDDDSHIESDDS